MSHPSFSHLYKRHSDSNHSVFLKQAFAPEKPRQQDTRIHEVEKSYFLHDGSFDGFLTIGTLGLDPSSTDPPTPTFVMPPEKIREEAIDAAKVELQLVNDELIKFLKEENKKKCIEMKESENMTCKRNICTLNREENKDMVTLPLQGYLFASSIDLPHTSVHMKKEKVSLRQLFEASNSACGHSTKKCEEKGKKDMRSYTKPFLKKIMNKLHSSSKSSTAHAADKPAVAPPSTKRKLSKALRLFNKKVHPEISGEEKKTEPYNIKDAKSSVHNNSEYTFQLNHTDNFPVKPMLKNMTSGLELEAHKVLENGDSTQNKEYWIRTDSDLNQNYDKACLIKMCRCCVGALDRAAALQALSSEGVKMKVMASASSLRSSSLHLYAYNCVCVSFQMQPLIDTRINIKLHQSLFLLKCPSLVYAKNLKTLAQ